MALRILRFHLRSVALPVFGIWPGNPPAPRHALLAGAVVDAELFGALPGPGMARPSVRVCPGLPLHFRRYSGSLAPPVQHPFSRTRCMGQEMAWTQVAADNVHFWLRCY